MWSLNLLLLFHTGSIYIQGVPKKCIHTLNNCKFRVYYNSNKFQHVKEFTNIILLSCYRMFSNSL